MFAKVKASPGQFDIIYNTAGWYDQYVQSDLIMPIDESKVPNVKEISDAFPWRDATSVEGTNYGILYTWGAQPLGWNEAEVPGDYDISQYVDDKASGRLEHLLGQTDCKQWHWAQKACRRAALLLHVPKVQPVQHINKRFSKQPPKALHLHAPIQAAGYDALKPILLKHLNHQQ